ncbi:hypothetical protein N1851_018399 [Merluccius polli]|uniref:SWIM-type domain-containing protein n=1 Tax=Merluccius polli TaxID=89951 RepID=A0AA47MN83_MERPO|nr:hypothetical protein N1851_018399 [Merluccius polli]
MAAVTVADISQEAIDEFWSQTEQISSRSHQKGLSYSMEGYVNDVVVETFGMKLQLQAKVYRSQCKREKPHLVAITIADNKIADQHCSCTAGEPGYCSHVIGLIHHVDRLRGKDHLSCTSQAQQWHRPRGKRIQSGQPITSVIVAKAKAKRKKKPVVCSYNPNRKESGVRAEVFEVIKNMTGAPISYLVSQTAVRVTVQGKELPIGCGLSYQVNNTLTVCTLHSIWRMVHIHIHIY